jgi:trans-aconitate methyltransferase
MLEPHTNIVQRMHIAHCITKAADTHSEYEIFLAFPRQQWLREHSTLLHLYMHHLSCNLYPNGFIGLAVPYEPNPSNPPRL